MWNDEKGNWQNILLVYLFNLCTLESVVVHVILISVWSTYSILSRTYIFYTKTQWFTRRLCQLHEMSNSSDTPLPQADWPAAWFDTACHVMATSYVGLLRVLGSRILRLRERARRSTAPPTLPPNSFLEVRPSMLPLYHMTQPARDSSTSSAPEYTSRSPKSRPWNSSGAKTPSSRDITPNRSISTANTRASLQWDNPSYFGAMPGKNRWGCYIMSSYTILCSFKKYSKLIHCI